jgi:hypothetical protein
MKKIVIVYHAYLYGSNYMDMIISQFRLLFSSGLYHACYKLYIGITVSENRNPENGVEKIKYFWRDSNNVEIVVHPENNETRDTLKWIKDYSKVNPNDYVLFFHTKGITKQNDATEDWRKYMEYFVIENWKDCIAKLDEGYDCCGVLWNFHTMAGYRPHFSGTFWWATTKYINTLNHTYLDSRSRYDQEFWIGTNRSAKAFEFHNSRLNDKELLKLKKSHYTVPYPRSNYVKIGDVNRLHVICTAYERPINLRILIDSFIVQTKSNWALHIIHDGKPSDLIMAVINSYDDVRINFKYTPERNQQYGHTNRKMMLEQLQADKNDYILITNDDNYYTPVFVEWLMNIAKPQTTGMVYCDTVHSLMQYNLFKTAVRVNGIDMGSFIVRSDIAKTIGFNGTHHSADGTYAVGCKEYCVKHNLEIKYIPKPLFVHN